MNVIRRLLLGTALCPLAFTPLAAQEITAVLSQNEVGVTSHNPVTSPLLSVAAWLLYDRLVGLDENLEFVPHLAESWVEAADGMSWTFTLKPGVTFHNGTPLTAQTIVDWLPLYEGSENAYLFDAIERAEAQSDLVVSFTMKRPDPNLLYNFSTIFASVFDPEAYKTLGEDFGVS